MSVEPRGGRGSPGFLQRHPRAPWPALLSALAAAGLFLALMPGVPGIGDSAEFTLALALAGVPHPTGYPLYVLLGHPFVLLLHAAGVGWVAAANAWSALGAAIAVGLYVELARWMMTDGGGNAALAASARPAGSAGGTGSTAGSTPTGSAAALSPAAAALVPAALLVLNPVWLQAATEAEVYSWWFAWVAGAALFVLGRTRALEAPGAAGPGGRSTALAWGFLCGVGLAHHLMAVMFIVPFSIVLAVAFARARRWRASFAGLAALGALPPLAAYAFLAYRAFHPAAAQWPLDASLAAVVRHASGAAYGAYLGRFTPNPAERALLASAVIPFLVPGLVLTAVYALRGPVPAVRGWLLAFLGGAALLVAFIVNYGVPDPAMYFAPALMAGLLVAAPVAAWVARRAPRPLAYALLGAVVLAAASWSLPRALAARARLVTVDRRIRAAWHAIPFERGFVLWQDDHAHRLRIFGLLERDRPGLDVENPNWLTWTAARARFASRFGFDPLAGLVPRTMADVARIPDNIRRQTSLPVADFPVFIERVRAAEARPR